MEIAVSMQSSWYGTILVRVDAVSVVSSVRARLILHSPATIDGQLLDLTPPSVHESRKCLASAQGFVDSCAYD